MLYFNTNVGATLALLFQPYVQRFPAWEPGSRPEKAPSRDLHQVLDLPLVVSLARSPKTLLEQVVRLQPRERLRLLPCPVA